MTNLYTCFADCLSVCFFLSNKRQNGWTDQTQILCGTLGPWEDLWMIKISKISLQKIWLSLNLVNPRTFLFDLVFVSSLLYKEEMFTIEIEDKPKIHQTKLVGYRCESTLSLLHEGSLEITLKGESGKMKKRGKIL